MLSKNELKYYSSLLKKKYRDKEGEFLVEGKRLVLEGMLSPFECKVVFFTSQFWELNHDIKKSLDKRKIRSELLSNNEFKRLADTKSPQGIAAVFKKFSSDKHRLYDCNLVVALENVSDPGNVGTIIRTCDWFGVTNLILSDDCADIYNSKVLRSTMGSIFHISSVTDVNLIQSLGDFKKMGFKLLVADMAGENIFNFKSDGKIVIVFANEAHGPSAELYSIIDGRINIPKIGGAESLNVASATAVILAELTKS